MRYLLDTNVWSEMARPESIASVRRAFHRYGPQFAMAALVVYGLILVTRKTDDFDGYLGIRVENWFN